MIEPLETLERRAAQAKAKRQQYPTAARIADGLRQHFPQARITWAQEGGRSIGERGDEGVIAIQLLQKESGK